MEELLKLIDGFEKRNNLSIGVTLFGDGSGVIEEFWDNETIEHFENLSDLTSFLAEGQLEMKDGCSVSPIKILVKNK